MYRWVNIAAEVATADLRHEEFMGRKYLVAPVVALIGDIVVWPSTAEHPELVPADVLELYPQGWDFRAVVLDHPPADLSTANTVENLEATQLGLIFNARFQGGALQFDAYIDEERVAAVGDDAIAVLEDLNAHKVVAVSVGAYVLVEETEGDFNGEHYWGIWRLLIPDHLAFLRRGTDGACSVATGCGAVLAAAANDTKGVSTMSGKSTSQIAPLLGRLARMLGPSALVEAAPAALAEGMSDYRLRSLLWQALREVEPGFADISDVFPTDTSVVYYVYLQDKYTYYERNYTVSGETVTVSEDRKEVIPTMKFETVAAAGAEGEPPKPNNESRQTNNNATPCKCGGGNTTMSETRAQRIDRLAARGWNRAKLEALPDAVLQAVDETAPVAETPAVEPAAAPAATPAATPAPATPPAAVIEDDPPATVEDWLAEVSAPADVANVVLESLAESRRQHGELVTALAAAQTVYTAQQLAGMPIAELRNLQALCASFKPAATRAAGAGTDFGVRAAAPTAGAIPAGATSTKPPRPYTLAMERRRKTA